MLETTPVTNSSNTPHTPPNLHGQSGSSVKLAKLQAKQTLQDMTGRELNLDGTPKMTYKHPRYGQFTTAVHEVPNKVQPQEQQAINVEEEEVDDGDKANAPGRARIQFPVLDNRRGLPPRQK